MLNKSIDHQKKKIETESSEDSDSDEESKRDKDNDEFKVKDGEINVDPKKRSVTQTLRVREDVAKYLRNLDPNSAFYDPKSRSMRENPNPELKPEETTYAGDNVARKQGYYKDWEKITQFAYQNVLKTGMKNTPFNPVASPSQTEAIFKQLQEKQKETKSTFSEGMKMFFFL